MKTEADIRKSILENHILTVSDNMPDPNEFGSYTEWMDTQAQKRHGDEL